MQVISLKDARLKGNQEKAAKKEKAAAEDKAPKHVDQTPSALWFKYNTALGPPYHVLVDTNFLNFSIKNKLEVKENCRSLAPVSRSSSFSNSNSLSLLSSSFKNIYFEYLR